MKRERKAKRWGGEGRGEKQKEDDNFLLKRLLKYRNGSILNITILRHSV